MTYRFFIVVSLKVAIVIKKPAKFKTNKLLCNVNCLKDPLVMVGATIGCFPAQNDSRVGATCIEPKQHIY